MAGRGKLRMHRAEPGWYWLVRDGVRWHIVADSASWLVTYHPALVPLTHPTAAVARFDYLNDAREWLRDRLARAA